MYRFNLWNLIGGFVILTGINICLESLQSPLIAYMVCGLVVALAFPWVERIEKPKGDKDEQSN